MPDFWSRTLAPTLREAPADAEVPSHRLMLRAGLVRRLGSGSYGYLPLGLRSLRKVERIIREEQHAAGAVEVSLPCLQPISLWERTGRRAAYGANLFVVNDRHGREAALAPTAEEAVADLVGATLSSYKDLPRNVYQIQTKFRDEFRPRFGVLRSREFLMKDGYSFHATADGEGGLDETYRAQYAAYERIFERCGLDYAVVEAETGEMGGRASHQFTVLTPTGEDTVFRSTDGAYAANEEKAATGERPSDLTQEPTGGLEEVETPGVGSIEEVTAFFKKELGSKLAAKNTLKTLVCMMEPPEDAEPPDSADRGGLRFLLVAVRGDHQLNDEKLKAAAERFHGPGALARLAPEEEAQAAGFPLGSVGPHAAAGRGDTAVAVDFDAAHGGFWVVGANRPDAHAKHFHWGRDLTDHLPADRFAVLDLRNALAGDPAPGAVAGDGGPTLVASRGIEVGQVFKLGAKYTRALGIAVAGADGAAVTPLMGCYGIGVNRVLASAIESTGRSTAEKKSGHDADGIIWPVALAPYAVVITPIAWEPDSQVADVCRNLAASLEEAGHDVLIDDRDGRPGPKFKDADLIGFPLRIVVGDKGLSADTPTVELVARDGSLGPRGEAVPLGQACKAALRSLG
ncbi:proline--tRNA ligase [Phycisphaera mikurensis]|uniref:Proline--tRNA ligase n=1 Tax=Phycisphaera mikurensis (strain NBRC 102666 / KCTC 22515 / FYK2301M01) TaxID=1142394 RepID=I0IIP6_PHYMF|nr:proline--tRNA ligase [Phycisphaera mikurensis]MBB6442714.1 prolyl-tRNA synthetase [Phycisphaera mikurensis]BAM05134.1 prolyl-tRNA synthetase [Phycisphaera mikurensis NBRC 102666]